VPTFKLTLAYDGTAYSGWQRQPQVRTVQGELERALAEITGESIRVAAAGRTDAHVHALGQVASLSSATTLGPDSLRRALNARLPPDIAVVDAALASDDFHATRDARSKRYRYVIHDGPLRDVFCRQYAWHVRRRLDAEAMHRAAQALRGTHDFRSFETHWPTRTTSVRTIFDIGALRQGDCRRELIHIEVEADGFLYNMVRAIVGTLVEVGQGRRDEYWPLEVLNHQDRRAAGMTAPPHGLFLLYVRYGDE